MVGVEELLAQPAIVGTLALDLRPERARMVHLPQVRQLVADHVVDELAPRLHEPPRKAHLAPRGAAAPARERARKREARTRHPCGPREDGDALRKILVRRDSVPPDHGALHSGAVPDARGDPQLAIDALGADPLARRDAQDARA